ncbi:MAG: hypothetical protein AAF221_03035 [Pseudomonadota bacterium]
MNGADIEAYGIEIDGFLAVTDEFSLNAAFSWNESELQGTDANISRFFLDTDASAARLPPLPPSQWQGRQALRANLLPPPIFLAPTWT